MLAAAQYCDLAQDAQLALTVWQIQEGQAQAPLGGATLRLFSKKGRLKSGRQELRLWRGREADTAWPPATPAKLPVTQRGELGCMSVRALSHLQSSASLLQLPRMGPCEAYG